MDLINYVLLIQMQTIEHQPHATPSQNKNVLQSQTENVAVGNYHVAFHTHIKYHNENSHAFLCHFGAVCTVHRTRIHIEHLNFVVCVSHSSCCHVVRHVILSVPTFCGHDTCS
jgi:hypothetical protein